MKEIRKINKFSLAKIMAAIYGLVGFVIALILAALTIINIVRRMDFQGSASLVALFNIGAGLLFGVVAALVTALIGWIIGFLCAAIYNWFAAKVGGIKLELADVTQAKKEETISDHIEEKKSEIIIN